MTVLELLAVKMVIVLIVAATLVMVGFTGLGIVAAFIGTVAMVFDAVGNANQSGVEPDNEDCP